MNSASLRFEWDWRKADTNLARHAVRFQVAVEVFDDPNVLFEDDPYSIGEYRQFAIGTSQSGLLFVVFTERHEDTVRIISARLAKPDERRRYRTLR